MYEEIQEQYPEEFAARDQNKYSYRYVDGLSLLRKVDVPALCCLLLLL